MVHNIGSRPIYSKYLLELTHKHNVCCYHSTLFTIMCSFTQLVTMSNEQHFQDSQTVAKLEYLNCEPEQLTTMLWYCEVLLHGMQLFEMCNDLLTMCAKTVI